MLRENKSVLSNAHLFSPGRAGAEKYRIPVYMATGSNAASGKMFAALFGANLEPFGYSFPSIQYQQKITSLNINAPVAASFWTSKSYLYHLITNVATTSNFIVYGKDGAYNFVLESTKHEPIIIEELNLLPFPSRLSPPDFTTKTFLFNQQVCPDSITVYNWYGDRFEKSTISTKYYWEPKFTQPTSGEPTTLTIPTNIIIDGNTILVFEYEANKIRTAPTGTAALILDIKYRKWKTT